ncbi:hypothetical protein A2U01_0101655, partial [Trifolium medium]|nr:hypothetical protein [Trifolium medium]
DKIGSDVVGQLQKPMCQRRAQEGSRQEGIIGGTD